jgi:hypothetical protein
MGVAVFGLYMFADSASARAACTEYWEGCELCYYYGECSTCPLIWCDNCGNGVCDEVGEEMYCPGDCYMPPPDDDGDGILNTADNCPSLSNPAQADYDVDGIGDD